MAYWPPLSGGIPEAGSEQSVPEGRTPENEPSDGGPNVGTFDHDGNGKPGGSKPKAASTKAD